MPEHTSPSPVMSTLVRELRAVLPSTQSTKLTAHEGEIEWIEDAVEVATIVAGAIGWDHVSWQNLVHELIDMEPVRT